MNALGNPEKKHRTHNYMQGVLDDFTIENVERYTAQENLVNKQALHIKGFDIINGIDNKIASEREIALVEIKAPGEYEEHMHKNSDAYWVVVEGQGTLILNSRRIPIKAGSRIQVPRGTWHGFSLTENEKLKFVSVQAPPIIDPKTGEVDFHQRPPCMQKR